MPLHTCDHFLQPPLSSLPLSRFPKLNISLWFLVTSCASLSSKCAYLEMEQSVWLDNFSFFPFFENDHPSREIVNRPSFLFLSFFLVQNLRIFFLFRQMSNDKCRMINRQESSSCSFLLPPRGWRSYHETRGSNVKKYWWMLWETESVLDSFFIRLTSNICNKFFLFKLYSIFHIRERGNNCNKFRSIREKCKSNGWGLEWKKSKKEKESSLTIISSKKNPAPLFDPFSPSLFRAHPAARRMMR